MKDSYYHSRMIPIRKVKTIAKLLGFVFLFTLSLKIRAEIRDPTTVSNFHLQKIHSTINTTGSSEVKFLKLDKSQEYEVLPLDYGTNLRNPSFEHQMVEIIKSQEANLNNFKNLQHIRNLKNAPSINLSKNSNKSKIPKDSFPRALPAAVKHKTPPVDKSKTKGKANKVAPKKKAEVNHKIDTQEVSLNASEINEILFEIKKINLQQKIYNEDKFGQLLDEDVVVIIQIHKRLEHLKFLVKSLRKAKGIQHCLVIFSHDYFDKEMNNFIQNISDFRLIQTFFPHSIQLHPNEFPGRDPRDCSWNHFPSKNNSKEPSCLNEKWHDSYGHYREPAFTQMKQHWWWKFHRVFRDIRMTRDFNGSVLFLEEDHYVSPDIFYTLNIMKNMTAKGRKDHLNHFIYGMGNYGKIAKPNSKIIEKSIWDASKYNMGFVVDRSSFDVINECSTFFCNYDDYNFDWTITKLCFTPCAKDKLIIYVSKLTRVHHFGKCGTHVRQKTCNVTTDVLAIEKQIQGLKDVLFTPKMIISGSFSKGKNPKRSNGGWGDLRDKELCLKIANGTDVV